MSFFSSSAPEEAATDGEGGLTEDQIAAAAFDTEAAAAAADVTDSPEMRARCEARGMPPPATWPSRPVLVRAAPHAKMTLDPDLPLPCGCAVPINDPNQPVPFETALFKGKMLARIRGVHGSDQAYFASKARQFQSVVQGTFKKRMRFDEVLSGQEFSQPLRELPMQFVVRGVLNLIKHRLPPGNSIDLFGDEPHFLSPFINDQQTVCVTDPSKGETPPDIAAHELPEDMRHAGHEIPDERWARRKYFSKQANLEKYYFEPGLVYTFDFYQHFFRPFDFKLDFKVTAWNIAPWLGEPGEGKPMMLTMAKSGPSGEYLWSFEMWHRKLLEA